MTTQAADGLIRTTESVRQALADTRLLFELPGVDDIRHERDAALGQLDDHILPRLNSLDAPALIVVGGSTGAGKSTLVNSLVGANVTRPGVLRPTTRAPVLVFHPESAKWFDSQRILPGLARVSVPVGADPGVGASHHELELVATTSVPTQLAILDAPDVDSVVAENRALATQLLAAADLWVFVTTAARYADAVPWDHLHTAAARGVSLVIVLNRVPPGARDEIAPHLTSMLDANKLAGVAVFGIDEQPLVEGRLPDSAVAPLRGWLARLAEDSDAREAAVRTTLGGVMADVSRRCSVIADATDEQVATADGLAAAATRYFAEARTQVAEDVRDGTVLRGEVLARWQDLVGTGELLRALESRLGRLRDRITAAVTGRPASGREFTGAIESGVATLLRRRVAEATTATYEAWRDQPAGRQLIDGAAQDLAIPAPDVDDRIAHTIREWQAGLLEMLRTEGASKRSTAKVLSYGVNGTALVLMVAVFAHTGGLTGAEVAIAGGTSAAGQKLMEALLGDQAVRRLAEQARSDLDRRVGVLMDRESARFQKELSRIELDRDAGPRLRTAAQAMTNELRAGGIAVGDSGAASS